jgi:hypothetical protein
MAERATKTSATTTACPYTIYGKPGYFTVRYTSPHNSLHQFSGVRSEDDVQAWIAELSRTYAEPGTASITTTRRRTGPSSACRIKGGRVISAA